MSQFLSQGNKPEPIANTVERRKIEVRMLELELIGAPFSEIQQIIFDEFPLFAKSADPVKNLRARYDRMKNNLVTDYEEQYLHIIPAHLLLYEFAYRRSKENGYKDGIKKSLKAKEKLLGMHIDEFYAEINNEYEEVKPIYNFDKLEPEEYEELKDILLELGVK